MTNNTRYDGRDPKEGYIDYHWPDEMMTNPPAPLTDAGHKLLQELYVAWENLPDDERRDRWYEGHMTAKLKFVTADRPRKSLQMILAHLIKGGYLIIGECGKLPSGDWNIVSIGLSKRGYDTVIAFRNYEDRLAHRRAREDMRRREREMVKSDDYVKEIIDFMGY